MTDLQLNAAGDLPVVLTLFDGYQLVGQRLTRRLRTALGEWFADTRVGIPYLELLAQKPFPLEVFSAYVQQEIASCPGIQAVQSFQVTQAEQTVTITATVLLSTTEAQTLEITFTTGNGLPGATSILVRPRGIA